jgi:Flp pilus assembly protein TadG
MAVFLGFTALAVDIGYMMMAKNELQNIADAAALAGARTLGRIYECNGDLVNCTVKMSYQDQQAYVADTAIISDAITNSTTGIAANNRSAGMNGITINTGDFVSTGDIIIGNWDGNALTPTLTSPDAVRVTARRDTSANGPITTFFARIFGINTTNVTAVATAALTGESTSGPGGLTIPVGIPKRWFQNPNFCGSHITFYPPCNKEPCTTADGCAGYTTFTDSPSSASFIKNTIMPGIPTGAYQSPATNIGTMFNFTGGTLSTLMNPPDYVFIALFNTMRFEQYDHDGNDNTWTAKAVVYDSDSCENPNQQKEVIGFTTIVITNVVGSPNPTVEGYVQCDMVSPGRGGGGSYGTKGSIPGLVQ